MTTDHKPGSREWAEAMARAGHKVRQTRWPRGEWMTYCNGILHHEGGAALMTTLSLYGSNDGWSLFEEAPEPDSLADLARRVAALEEQFSRHFHMTDAREDRSTPPVLPDPPAPITLTIGGQYRTRGGWRCVVVDITNQVGPLVWHDKDGGVRWHKRSGVYVGAEDYDIIGPWEGEE